MSAFAPPEEEMIPPEVAARVKSELAPGERLLWSGQPVPGRAALVTLPLVIFAVPFTGFACFWSMLATGLGGMAGLSIRGPGGAGFGLIGALMGLFGLPFLLIGLAMLTAPFWAYRMARQTCYALTDRRAITWNANPFGGVRVRSFTPQALARIARNERADGSGDLIFEEYATRDRHGHRRVTAFGFMNIRDVHAVEDLLRKTLTPQ